MEQNKSITWVNVLHIYQPPTQTKDVIDTVVRESYRTILHLLDTYPTFKVTMNISGSLIELLVQHGYSDIVSGFKKHVESGKIEMLGSAMYHPILPLLPKREIERQINLQTAILKKHFGKAYRPKGFYIPEMAYSDKLADVIQKNGFHWIALDETHHPGGKADPRIKYCIADKELSVLFRNSMFSRSFPPQFILENKDTLHHNAVVTVHDGELYGHWHKNDNGFYEKIFTSPDVICMTASEYLATLTKTETITPREASWESTQEELAQNIPYGLWNHPKNKIHKKMEQLKKFALRAVHTHKENPRYNIARNYLDKGLASCAWWWASERVLGPFSPLTWNPTEVEKGAHLMLSSVRSLKGADPELKVKAEKLFDAVHDTVWKKHWKEHNDQ